MPGPRPQPRFCRRRKRWHVTLRGKQYILGVDEGLAYEKFGRLYRQVYGDGISEHPKTVTTLLASWLTQHPSPWHHQVLRDFGLFAKGVDVRSVPQDLLERFAGQLTGAPQTVRHKVRYATRVLRWGLERELIARMPRAPKLPRVPIGHRDIPLAKLPEILSQLDRDGRRHIWRIVRFALLTGCRPGEARTLRWRDVDLDDRVCRLAQHKTAHRTGADRVVYLHDDAVQFLGSMHCGCPTALVFTSRHGQQITKDAFSRALKRWCGVTPNQLRHTWAQHALSQTSREDVAKLLGHRTTRSVDVYAQVRDSRARKVADSLTPIQAVSESLRPAAAKRKRK